MTFRETETSDGWRTLRGGGWDSARAAGIEPQLSSLSRDGVVLALEATDDGRSGNRLSHIGIAVDEAELNEVRLRAELSSNGARAGRWLGVPGSVPAAG